MSEISPTRDMVATNKTMINRSSAKEDRLSGVEIAPLPENAAAIAGSTSATKYMLTHSKATGANRRTKYGLNFEVILMDR
jgi:hypothetical protein